MTEIENKGKNEALATVPDDSLMKCIQKIEEKIEDQRELKLKQDEPGKVSPAGNLDDWLVSATRCFGTADQNLTDYFLTQVACTSHGLTEANSAEHLNKLTPILRGINPQDELEGMLACQMVGVHNLAMEMMKRAIQAGQTVDGVTENINRVTKLLRTFTAQIEALNRHRGKGQQKMTVEHVHVHQGGQAIVGNINQGGG